MTTPRLYIIAGPNGAGKTTASKELLPQLWECGEFVNADEIARGLSPYRPEEVAVEAGRLMLNRIDTLLEARVTFAIETTLATRSYRNLVERAHKAGYEVTLVYFWLPDPEVAVNRVKKRVLEGGHNIPTDVIYRRYFAGMKNLQDIFMPIVDKWVLCLNEDSLARIAKKDDANIVYDKELFNKMMNGNG